MTTTPHTTSAIAFSDRVMEVFRAIYGPAQGDVLDSVRLASAQAFTELAASAPVAPAQPGFVLVPVAFVRGFSTLAHNYSLRAEPPDHYHGVEGDAFRNAYARCGRDLAELSAMLKTTPEAAPVAPAPQPADPMDWPLPCAVTVGHGTMHKGVPLRTLIQRMKVLYEMATGNNADEVANRTPDELQERRNAFLEAVDKAVPAAPLQQGEYLPTGNPEADRVLGRLNSSDPDFDDCAEAAALICKLVAEAKGPGVFATWKDAAVYERGLRAKLESMINTASPLAYLYTDGKHPGLDFEHSPAEDLRPGFVCIPLVAAHRAAQASPPAPSAQDADRPHGFIKPDTGTHVYFYEQDFYVLSNFSAFTLYWDGVENMRFDTSEAAYHWEKFPGHDDIRAAIINAPSAHEAFKVAERNKAHRRPDWDDVKVDVMRRILRAKAEQHEYVRRKLLATGNRTLVEDSWRDAVWGWGPNRDGQNLLGKLWMEVRAELRAQQKGGA